MGERNDYQQVNQAPQACAGGDARIDPPTGGYLSEWQQMGRTPLGQGVRTARDVPEQQMPGPPPDSIAGIVARMVEKEREIQKLRPIAEMLEKAEISFYEIRREFEKAIHDRALGK